jgi:hypothetical protein
VNSKLNEDINVDPFAAPTNKNNKTNGKQLAITTTTKNSNKSSRQNIFKNKSASFDEDYDD